MELFLLKGEAFNFPCRIQVGIGPLPVMTSGKLFEFKFGQAAMAAY